MPSQALPRQLPQRGSQGLKPVAKVLGAMRRFPAVLLPLPLRKDFPRSGGRCRVATKGGVWHRAAMTERAHAVSPVAKVSNAIRNFTSTSKSSPFRGSWRAAPERVQPYIITLYRQSKSQPGIDGGLYYPPESIQCCQAFPCKILSRKISTIFGDCYKTQNIVVFCLTCH